MLKEMLFRLAGVPENSGTVFISSSLGCLQITQPLVSSLHTTQTFDRQSVESYFTLVPRILSLDHGIDRRRRSTVGRKTLHQNGEESSLFFTTDKLLLFARQGQNVKVDNLIKVQFTLY